MWILRSSNRTLWLKELRLMNSGRYAPILTCFQEKAMKINSLEEARGLADKYDYTIERI